ncbi:MAG: YggS family pyridoxal phosphate-dependent enzyme [Trueperaceae bacterium]
MLQDVLRRIETACRRAGRDPSEVTLVAVTKGHAAAAVERHVLQHGHRVLGENRAQELRDKRALLPADIEWHFIGNLQRNKVKYLSGVAMVHSLTTPRLADALDRQAAHDGRPMRVLLEVNVAGEASKQGADPDDAAALARYVRGLPHLRLEGLMTMAPYSDDPEAARPVFRAARALRDELGLRALSMGMSNDFEIAVEEGATLVRVGTALFEPGPVEPRPDEPSHDEPSPDEPSPVKLDHARAATEGQASPPERGEE